MKSLSRTNSHSIYRRHLRMLATGLSVRIGISLLLWYATPAIGLAQTQSLAIHTYYADDGHGNCINYGGSDTVCGNLAVTVAPDAIPGDYVYDLRCNPDILGGGGDTVRLCCGYGHETTVHVTVNPDNSRSFTLDPDAGLACMTNAGGRGLSRLYPSIVTAPAGAVHGEGDVNVTITPVYCLGGPTTLYVDIPVTIGSAITAVSRKVHGTAGAFDVNLPLSGTRGVECRSGGPNGNHIVVFTFPTDITGVDGASVTPCGQVNTTALGPNSNQYTVNLTNACNGQYVTVGLTGVHYIAGGTTAAVSATMGVLLGDSNGDGLVNVGDTVLVRSQSGNDLSSSTFREDLNTDGVINAGDTIIVRGQSGASLPTPP